MRLLGIFFLFAFTLGCSGQSMEQDGGNLTRGEVELLSARMTEAVEREFPLLQHKLVNRYVSTLGQSIISRNPDMPPLPYEFRVLRTNQVLAFSLPGGVVYISLGALRAANLEGQLASVLAHELAHQQLNHPLIQWRRKVNANRGQRNLLDFSGGWETTFLGPRGALFLDKGMEQEADSLAPVILYRARVDPRLYMSYLQLLKKIQGSAPADVAALLSLHPPMAERLDWVKASLVKLPPLKEPSVSSPSFEQIRALLQEAAKKSEPKKGKQP